MRMRIVLTSALLATILSTSPALAQDSLVSRSTIHEAIVTHATAEQAHRDVVLKALRQPDVRQLADRMGMDLTAAEEALGGLTATELAELARPAQAIVDRSGGDRTITISLTTLLLGIIVLLLVAD